MQMNWVLSNKKVPSDSHAYFSLGGSALKPLALFWGPRNAQILPEENWLLPFEWTNASNRSIAFCLQGLNKHNRRNISLAQEHRVKGTERQLLLHIQPSCTDFKEGVLWWSVKIALNTSKFAYLTVVPSCLPDGKSCRIKEANAHEESCFLTRGCIKSKTQVNEEISGTLESKQYS